MKYIIIKDETFGVELPILFSEMISHREMFDGISSVKKVSLISAGMCYCTEETPYCCGESTTLNIKSRGDVDTELMKRVGNLLHM